METPLLAIEQIASSDPSYSVRSIGTALLVTTGLDRAPNICSTSHEIKYACACSQRYGQARNRQALRGFQKSDVFLFPLLVPDSTLFHVSTTISLTSPLRRVKKVKILTGTLLLLERKLCTSIHHHTTRLYITSHIYTILTLPLHSLLYYHPARYKIVCINQYCCF